ncbi:unnamed protein product [Pieris brassicae]|uniref:Uncharacterized protein n=1 Tax=Pieris brassicae TaxID=7116 RepID=A0A9P0XE40_PIEBR|nr:unnamed protein product [Pieris brassicae]
MVERQGVRLQFFCLLKLFKGSRGPMEKAGSARALGSGKVADCPAVAICARCRPPLATRPAARPELSLRSARNNPYRRKLLSSDIKQCTQTGN